jgi:hypothetical protein
MISEIIVVEGGSRRGLTAFYMLQARLQQSNSFLIPVTHRSQSATIDLFLQT